MFSQEKINSGRQLELDIARGLAVLFMIFIHSQIFFANESVSESAFGVFNDFVGMVPAAPMFMFLLGIGINYTRKSDPQLFFKRGALLILAGYLLNFLKGFLPCIVNAYRTADIAYVYEGIAELLYVDILHFSGLAMIMFGVFKLTRSKTWVVVLSAFVLGAVNIALLPVSVTHPLMTALTGLIWGTSEYAYFPFLTWAFYPIMGYVFGSYLIRCNNKKKFYSIMLLISTIVFIGGTYLFNGVLGLPNGMMSESGYYHHILTDNITFTALVVIEIALLSFVAPLLPKDLELIVARWSKNVTPIFFIHWLLITWSALLIVPSSLNMLQFVLLLLVLVPLSDLLAYLYSQRKRNTKLTTSKLIPTKY